jgi:hypothetical protein
LPSRYSIDDFIHNAAPHHIYTFEVGTANSWLLGSSCTLGQGFLPQTTEYTGATVVKGETLDPGTAVTYRTDKDGFMIRRG